MKILVAEDSAVHRRLLKIELQSCGYDVVMTRDGSEAWNILQVPEAPKLALLDWVLPGIDGVTLCQQIRSRPLLPYVYIVLLTAKQQKQDLLYALKAGVDDYLVKPFDGIIAGTTMKTRGGDVTVTVSMGVTAVENGQVTNPETLLHVADCALYQAKNDGRNRVKLTTDISWVISKFPSGNG